MSANDLAKRSGVSRPTIQRFEQTDGIPPSRSGSLLQVKRALEEAGAEFFGDLDKAPGLIVRLERDKALQPLA